MRELDGELTGQRADEGGWALASSALPPRRATLRATGAILFTTLSMPGVRPLTPAGLVPAALDIPAGRHRHAVRGLLGRPASWLLGR